jgi:signal transduction histidine kinase
LISVALTLRHALSHLGEHPDPRPQEAVRHAMTGLRQALADIRELARGIHPAILVQQGLAAAVTSLAEGAPLPVVVRIPTCRFAMLVESTAYYVIAEAVANTVRHARATWVEVSAREQGGWLVIEVADDGIGGASAARGTGLQGLVDRTATLGGRLQLESTPGRGTRLIAELPRHGPLHVFAGNRLPARSEDDSSCSA